MLSQQRTLVLILDDLHWADSASLNLLFHLACQLQDSRVLIVGTYRSDDVALGRLSTTSGRVERHPFEPILNEIRRYAGEVVIDLGVAQLAEGRALVDALVDIEPNQPGVPPSARSCLRRPRGIRSSPSSCCVLSRSVAT